MSYIGSIKKICDRAKMLRKNTNSRSGIGSQSGVTSNSTGPSQAVCQTNATGIARSNRAESVDCAIGCNRLWVEHSHR